MKLNLLQLYLLGSIAFMPIVWSRLNYIFELGLTRQKKNYPDSHITGNDPIDLMSMLLLVLVWPMGLIVCLITPIDMED